MLMRIFHTNDIHANVEFIKRVHHYMHKYKSDNDLYLDSGDFCDLRSLIVQADRGDSLMQLFKSCKMDHMAIGNNEIDLGYDSLVNIMKYDMLSCNLSDNDGNDVFRHSVIVEKCHKRFLIMGISPYYNSELVAGHYNLFFEMGNLKTRDCIKAINDELDKYDGQYDFSILLSHSGIICDDHIKKHVKHIDLWLGGHSHSEVAYDNYNQAGMGSKLGVVSLEVDDTIKITGNKLIDLKECDDALFDHLYQEKEAYADSILSKPLKSLGPLAFDAYHECELINFICDILLEVMDGDLAIMHHGIANNALNDVVSKKDLLNTFPSKLNPTSFVLSGKKIREAIMLSFDDDFIRQSGKGSGFRGYTLGTLGYSANVRIVGNDIYINNELMDDDKLYKVVSDDYLQRGTYYHSMKVDDKDAYFDPRFIRDVVEEYLDNDKLYALAKIKRVFR